MEIKTVRAKLSEAKNKAVKKAVELAPYVTIFATSGAIVYITAKASYIAGYGQGFITGNINGKNAVIEIISNLAKSVETK